MLGSVPLTTFCLLHASFQDEATENNWGLFKRKKWRINTVHDLLWEANGLLSCEYFNWHCVKLSVYWPATTRSLVYVFPSLWQSAIQVILGHGGFVYFSLLAFTLPVIWNTFFLNQNVSSFRHKKSNNKHYTRNKLGTY